MDNVNSTDIDSAIRMGCRTMCNVFNADDDEIPYFYSSVKPNACFGFSEHHSEAHIPGRHLNALLNAEDSVGIRLDEAAIDKHASAVFYSYSGPVPFPLNRNRIDGPLENFTVHNIREGFHALYALVKYRNSQKARRLAEESIDSIFRYWRPEKGWNVEYFKNLGLNVLTGHFISGIARTIGPLVKYYKCTSYEPALALAIALKEKAVNEYFTEDGSYDIQRFGTHVHSITCVMSSLAQLAELLSDSCLINRVKAFYDHGLCELRDALGWAVECADLTSNPDRGEVNSTGDIVETGLILGKWGYTDYYHDVERILRCHLLPSQLRDISFIRDPESSQGVDAKRDVANRHLGAFGFPAPYGHQPIGREEIGFNMDIVGGTVGSLCEVYREITSYSCGMHKVNLLFDHETSSIKVESPYTHDSLNITVKRPGPLFIRIPPWVDSKEIIVHGVNTVPVYSNSYMLITQPLINRQISIIFPLITQEIVLNHRTRQIRTRLKGDMIVEMDNFGADLTFFDLYK